MISRPRVILVTNVFSNIENGPGAYARYLWDAFKEEPAFDFHVVAPDLAPDLAAYQPRLHCVTGKRMGRLAEMSRLALALANQTRGKAVIHGNAAHSATYFVGKAHNLVVQVNDYEVATVFENIVDGLRSKGTRRILTLVRRRMAERRVTKAANRVICNSDFTRGAVIRAYSLKEANCRRIYKATDLNQFRRPKKLPPDPLSMFATQKRLIFVGANWPLKGLEILLLALAGMNARGGNISLTVIGPTEPRSNARLMNLARSLRVEDQILFKGVLDREQLPTYLWHSDLFVLPSREEALGVSILEALAAGLPVVATRVGGIPEILEGERGGLLVPPNDVPALADAIAAVLSDPALYSRLVERAQKNVERFDVSNMVRSVRSLYAELLDFG